MKIVNKKERRKPHYKILKYTNNNKRKISESKEENIEDEKELKIFLLSEEYERKSIFGGDELPHYYQKCNDYTFLERRDMVQVYMKDKNQKYSIDELLSLDNTNKDLWIIYANKPENI